MLHKKNRQQNTYTTTQTTQFPLKTVIIVHIDRAIKLFDPQYREGAIKKANIARN